MCGNSSILLIKLDYLCWCFNRTFRKICEQRQAEDLVQVYHEISITILEFNFFIQHMGVIIDAVCCGNSQSATGPSRLSVRQRTGPLQVIPLGQLDDHLSPQFLILPSQYEYFHANLEPNLRNLFPNLIVFQNKEELQKYKQDGKNNILVVGCTKPDVATQIRKLKNFHTFSQIGVACNLQKDITEQIRKSCQAELGFRFTGILKYSSQQIAAYMQTAGEGRSVYFCHKDNGLINRANLFFQYFFRRDGQYDPVYFFEWANRSAEGREFVDRLRSMNKSEIGKFIALNIFGQNHVCLQAVEMLKQTRNPYLIGHTAWFSSTLFEFIKKSYPSTKRQLGDANKYAQKVFVVWVGLNKVEQEYLKQIESQGKQENFMFSTFVIASTNFDKPKPENHSPLQLFKFIITIPFDLEEYRPIVDLGFYYDQDKAIFNIQNMYRVDGVHYPQREVYVSYCSVGTEYNIRVGQTRYKLRAKPHNMRMMTCLDFYFLNQSYINSQLDLVFFLQFYHLYKKLAPSVGSLISTSVSINETVQTSKGCIQKLGDCELQIGNYDSAIQHYQRIVLAERSILKKLNLYFVSDNRVRYRDTMNDLESDENRRENVYTYFIKAAANYFKAIMMDRRGEDQRVVQRFLNKIIDVITPLYNSTTNKMHEQGLAVFAPFYMASKVKLQILKSEMGKNELPNLRTACEQTKRYLDGVHIEFLPEL